MSNPWADAMALLERELGARPVVAPVRVHLPVSRATPPIINLLRNILTHHVGSRPVELRLVNGDKAVTLHLPHHVTSQATVVLAEVLGREAVT